jgi:hypothetical protein
MEKQQAELAGLTLDNLASGAAEERFQYEMDKVLANIADRNTDPEAKRKITLEIVFAPMGDREVIGLAVNVTSKLAGLKPVSSTAYLVERNGVPLAVARDIRQIDAFEPTDPSVRPINHARQAEG